MSAINPVIQTPPRLNPDQFTSGAGQTEAPAAQQGFSDTLHGVSAKPVRKSAPSRAQHPNDSGDTLPAAGNHSPPTTPATQVTSAAPSVAAANPGAPANSAAISAAATAAPAAGTSGVVGSAPVSTGAAQTANAASNARAAVAAEATAAANATTVTNAGIVATAAPVAEATSAADKAVGNPAAASAKDAAAAALGSSRAPISAPGPGGEISQFPAAAEATAVGSPVQMAADGATANAAAAAQAPTKAAADNSTNSSSSNGIAGRSPAAMRAVYPTGNSGASTPGKSTAVGGQDPGNAPPPDASAAATSPAAQVDTAAMISALQATSSPASPAPAAQAEPLLPPGRPGDAAAGPLGLGANSDVPSALPALAAAAASAAQVVSTIAAGAAADKKSHDSQSQIAATSAASSTSDAVGAAQLLNAQGTPHTDSAALPTFKVNAAVDSPDFSQNVASHVSTMLDGNVNSAKLQVNPPALGPIEVRISIQGDHAQVWMASHSAVTRDALQDAAPQLREMLNSQGFAQVSVDISQRSFQERTPTAHAYEWNGESNAASTSSAGSSASVASRASSGVLDAYA